MTPSWCGSDQGKLFPRYGLQYYSPNTVQLARHSRRLANPLGDRICEALVPTFDPKSPTALFVGRYQPFHSGHLRLIDEGLRRVGQVCIAVCVVSSIRRTIAPRSVAKFETAPYVCTAILLPRSFTRANEISANRVFGLHRRATSLCAGHAARRSPANPRHRCGTQTRHMRMI